MKIAMPLMLAWWFQKRDGQLRPLDFLVAGLLLLFPVALIVRQPDLGTAILVLSAGMAVIFFAGLSWFLIVPPIILGVIGVGLVVFFEPTLCADGFRWPILHDYQQQRICTLLDPTRDPLGKGFHIIQGMIAIGSGGFWGKGFMQGTQTHLDFIPERTTDFVFAAYSEEFGLIGVTTVIFMFLWLARRIMVIGRQSIALDKVFSGLVAQGVGIWIGFQAFINMGVNLGALPTKGLTLPLMSYGGSAIMMNLVAIAIVLRIDAENKQMMRGGRA